MMYAKRWVGVVKGSDPETVLVEEYEGTFLRASYQRTVEGWRADLEKSDGLRRCNPGFLKGTESRTLVVVQPSPAPALSGIFH